MSKLISHIPEIIYRPVFFIDVPPYISLNGNEQNKLPFYLSSNTSSPTKLSNVIYQFNGFGFHDLTNQVPWLIKCSILYYLNGYFNYGDYEHYNIFIKRPNEKKDIIDNKIDILKKRIKLLARNFKFIKSKKYEKLDDHKQKICCKIFYEIVKSFNSNFDINKYLDKQIRFSYTYKSITTTIDFDNIIEDTYDFNKIIGKNNFFGLDLSNIKWEHPKGPTIDEILYTLLNNIAT